MFGQHYSYTDVVMNDVPLGFDIDFVVRHAGIAVGCAWLVWRRAGGQGAQRWWVVVFAAASELLIRADNTALNVLLEPAMGGGELLGEVLPPMAGAVGIVAASGWLRSAVPETGPSGA